MKKFFATIAASLLMLAGTQAFAQVSVGAGYLGSPLKLSSKNIDLSKSFYMNGIYAGIDNTLMFDKNMGISLGLQYIYSGASAGSMFESLKLVENYAKGNLQEHYINMPFNLVFSFDVQPGLKTFFCAGPTVSCGLSSKVKANLLGDLVKFNLVNNYKNNRFNRMDLLFGVGAGIVLNDHIKIKADYDYGFFNHIGDGMTIKNKDGMDVVAIKEGVNLNRSQVSVGVSYVF